MSFYVEFFPLPLGERIGNAGRAWGVKVCQGFRALLFLSASSDSVTGDDVELVHRIGIVVNLLSLLLFAHHDTESGDQASVELRF